MGTARVQYIRSAMRVDLSGLEQSKDLGAGAHEAFQ